MCANINMASCLTLLSTEHDHYHTAGVVIYDTILLLLLQMSWIRVLPSHSCGGTLQKSGSKTVAQLNADVC